MATSYREILELAQRLPVHAQIELAEDLLHNVRAQILPREKTSQSERLSPLVGLSEAELTVLADAVVAPEHHKRLQTLLEQKCSSALSADEQAALDVLVGEVDQIALLKARAHYTLHPP